MLLCLIMLIVYSEFYLLLARIDFTAESLILKFSLMQGSIRSGNLKIMFLFNLDKPTFALLETIFVKWI